MRQEGLVLLVAAPLLMFPTVWPAGAWWAAGLLLLIWFGQWMQGDQPLLPTTPLTLPLALWLVMVGVGVLVTADPDLAWPRLANLFLGVAVWRYAVLAIRNRRDVRLAWGALLLLGLVMIISGVLSANWQAEVPLLRPFVQTLPPRLMRLPGTAPAGTHMNQLAGTVAVVLPLVLVTLPSWRPGRRAAFGLLLALNLGLLALLLLTQSRSAWVAAGGSLLSLWLFAVLVWPPSGRRRFAGVLLLAVLLALLAGLLSVGPARLQELWEEPPSRTPLGTLTTLEARKEIWRWALLTIQDFPLTGCGLGAFRRVAHRLYPLEVPKAGDIAHAHNIFLQVALDTGLPGLVAYLAVLGLGLFMAWQVARRAVEHRPFALGLATALVAFHLFGLADAIAPGAKPGLLYWAILGMVTTLHQLAPQRAAEPLSLAGEG